MAEHQEGRKYKGEVKSELGSTFYLPARALILAAIMVFLTASCIGPHSPTYTTTPTAVTQPTTGSSSTLSADVQWLKANAIPFETAEPNSGSEDLMPLKKIVGDARIVALGEATHGTHEFFQMKHRMLEFLVEEMGFNTFAMEAAWPEANLVNDYVHTGKGEPAQILRGYAAGGDAPEVLDMIEWMRAYNENPNNTRKISFYGFDLGQAGPMAGDNVVQYGQKVDPQAAKQLADDYACYPQTSVACQTKWQAAYDWLAQHQADYTTKSSAEEFGLALQSARVAIQYQTFAASNGNGLIRDPYMAENVTWILNQAGPDAKIVLWAHNDHVGISGEEHPFMGDYLRKQYGNQMVVFAFLFYQGSFHACGMSNPQTLGIGVFQVGAPPTNSYESFLHEAGLPRFFLDLRSVRAGGAASDWFLVPHPYRRIGGCYRPTVWGSGFDTAALAKKFDVAIYFQDTSPSLLLEK